MKLEEIINYKFRNPDFLKLALTHSSYLNEHHLEKTECNERLEFLGDAVLECVSSEFLFNHFPDLMEGELSKIRAQLVCEDALSVKARDIHLGEFLILGKGMEKGNGRNSNSILSDAIEALIAAIFLDSGIEDAKKFILTYILNENPEPSLLLKDKKTCLQELAQAGGHHVTYDILDETGPEHNKEFHMAVYIDGKLMGEGTGHTKKIAEQNASFEAIKKIKGE